MQQLNIRGPHCTPLSIDRPFIDPGSTLSINQSINQSISQSVNHSQPPPRGWKTLVKKLQPAASPPLFIYTPDISLLLLLLLLLRLRLLLSLFLSFFFSFSLSPVYLVLTHQNLCHERSPLAVSQSLLSGAHLQLQRQVQQRLRQ